MKVAFLGLGVMGFPMAGHLANNGHDVVIYNRTAKKAEKWCETYKGNHAPTPKDAAKGADIVFACVGNDNDLEHVTIGKDDKEQGEFGAFYGMNKGALFVDHTTVSATVTRKLAEIAAGKGLNYIDAPVSGGQAGAEGGILTVMCGGDENHFATAKPIIDSYARICNHMGAVGCGQLTKMVNQICIAGLLQGLSEGVAFGMNAGLDMDKVLQTIRGGAAQSWQMENRLSTMVGGEFNFGFAVDWMIKDLGICLAEARQNGSDLPITALIEQFYTQVQRRGGARFDTSSLITLLNR